MSDEKKKYRDLLIDLHKENQDFLNKAIFGVSSLAIPVLLNIIYSKDSNQDAYLLNIPLLLFAATILIQIVSTHYAKEGCDLCISEEDAEKKKGEEHFEVAGRLAVLRDALFATGMLAVTIGPMIFSLN